MKAIFFAAIVALAFCKPYTEPRYTSQPKSDRPNVATSPAFCTLIDNRLVQVEGSLDPVSGDTLLAGRSVKELYRTQESPYAMGRAWFQRNNPIRIGSSRLFKNFPPRRFGPEELVQVGEFQGTPLFVEVGARTHNPSIVYVLVDASCLFQAYYVSE